MIRFALALLGLSAGAADAQRLVPAVATAVPVLESCGLHVDVRAETDRCSEQDGGVAGAPTVPVDHPVTDEGVVAAARAIVVRAQDATPKLPEPRLPAVFVPIQFTSFSADAPQGVACPFPEGAVFAQSVDGSDPSAMFCP